MVGRIHGGLMNQAGFPGPFSSPWGQTLARDESRLINDPAPIGTRKKGFGGNVGGFISFSANVGVLPAQRGYWGDLPQTQQDIVTASPPWERP